MLFSSFSDKISNIFEKLRHNGALKEFDVDQALREIRISLLEADVALDVAKKFIADIKGKAIGQEVIKSVSPTQMVVKIVHDALLELLGTSTPINISSSKPYKIVLVGLQGAGKTTSAAKLANYFAKLDRRTLLSSTDIYRPAAIDQLGILAQKIKKADFFKADIETTDCTKIAKQALREAISLKSDILLLDTAGRLHVDEVKMEEIQSICEAISPDQVLLVADIMTGQEAFNVAKKFSEAVPVSGIILTRADGDARGGVALSMRAVTGCEIKFLGTGEQLDGLMVFDPSRIADRLLGMGDIVSLVEKAQENFSQMELENEAKKLQSGIFTFDDFANQMEKMSKLGGLKGIVKLLPQSGQIEKMLDQSGVSDSTVARNIAIIRSMTKKERRNYKLLNGKRRKRIATGSGTSIQEVNRLIKQYEGIAEMIKKMKNKGFMQSLMSMMRGR